MSAPSKDVLPDAQHARHHRRWEAETGQQAVTVIPEQVTDAT